MAGEATIQELHELENLMQQNKEWKQLSEQLLIDQPGITDENIQAANNAFAVHSSRIQFGGQEAAKVVSIRRREISRRWILRIAAIFIVIVAAAAIYIFKRSGKPNKVTTADIAMVSTKRGSRTQVQLPDGTVVSLNSESRISYSKDFGKQRREVTLSGEAFFDVKHDSTTPFIVHANYLTIRARGTAFNIMSYPEDNRDEVSLIKGEVEVSFNGNSFILKPFERLLFALNSTQPDSDLAKFDSAKYLDEGYLGMTYSVEDLTREQKQKAGYPANGEGVYVSNVAWDGAARVAGIKPGDVITKINEAEVSSGERMSLIITDFKAGDKIRVTYRRDGLELTTIATLKNSPGNYSEPIHSVQHIQFLKKDSTICETAWLDNKLTFCDESFAHAARKLEQWFNVKIMFANAEVTQYRVSGVFEKETLVEILDDLRKGFNFSYRIEGNVITIEK